jgi:hypothetical protein
MAQVPARWLDFTAVSREWRICSWNLIQNVMGKPACTEVNFDAIHCVVWKSAANFRILLPLTRIAFIRSMSEGWN